MSQPTVTINGTVYDAHTGMPINKTEKSDKTEMAPKRPQTQSSHAVHQTTQKSQTLNRRIVEKKAHETLMRRLSPQVKKSPAITKFAPNQIVTKQPQVMSDIGPTSHPLMAKANQVSQSAGPAAQAILKPSQVIKQEAIAEALKKAPSHNAHKKQNKKKRKPSRFFSIVSASLALLLLGGYLTYLNMPSLSVRVAAAQAGVNATYPEYHPDGYSLNGPVAYSQGEVTMKFASNGGPQNFTVAQTKSSWDSSAVLDNYVKEKAGDNYIAYSERGLTIYTFGGNAAWVNGGILYKINGDAPLSSDQIRRIATSL